MKFLILNLLFLFCYIFCYIILIYIVIITANLSKPAVNVVFITKTATFSYKDKPVLEKLGTATEKDPLWSGDLAGWWSRAKKKKIGSGGVEVYIPAPCLEPGTSRVLLCSSVECKQSSTSDKNR